VKTLEFVGATPADVVQAKCFVTPIESADDVKAAFEKVFHRDLPIVMVEWKSNLPIEIELIAQAPPREDAPAIEYLTPSGATPSPLFARISRLSGASDIIYTAGIFSAQPGSGEEQVKSIFEQLTKTLDATGSDLRHLAKATYYVSDDDGCILERDPLERVATDGELRMYAHDGFWQCMDTLRDLQRLEEHWSGGKAPWINWR
jgi:enamine deaminase RidA (YjgF/YER057c/UK114 family)